MLMIWQLAMRELKGWCERANPRRLAVSWTWFALGACLICGRALRPGRFALWLGFAAALVGIIASVARWPWPAEAAAFAAFTAVLIPVWRVTSEKLEILRAKWAGHRRHRPQSTSR